MWLTYTSLITKIIPLEQPAGHDSKDKFLTLHNLGFNLIPNILNLKNNICILIVSLCWRGFSLGVPVSRVLSVPLRKTLTVNICNLFYFYNVTHFKVKQDMWHEKKWRTCLDISHWELNVSYNRHHMFDGERLKN